MENSPGPQGAKCKVCARVWWGEAVHTDDNYQKLRKWKVKPKRAAHIKVTVTIFFYMKDLFILNVMKYKEDFVGH